MDLQFERSTHLPVEPKTAFDWHEAPGALERLMPPWEPASLESSAGGIKDGATTTLKIKLGPLPVRWVAKHSGYEPPHQFEDHQEQGPFAKWHHRHLIEANPACGSILTDAITYRPPLGLLGRVAGRSHIETKLDRMFAYRHRITRDDLAFHDSLGAEPHSFAITGASGLVGSTLAPLLTTGGHIVRKLTRSTPNEECERQWDPQASELDPALFYGCDAVIHLAGESVLGLWTDEKKRRIRESRVGPTELIARTLASMPNGPRTLVVASAIGIYGDRGDERLDENSSPGTGFLAEVARDWEAAADPAREAGIRVVHVRLGIVLSGRGGALKNMLLPFRFGLGGTVGRGNQRWSWIAIDDAASIFAWAALSPEVSGVVNATAPTPVSNEEFTHQLAAALSRPAFIPVPRFGVKTVLGEMGEAILLDSVHAVPERTQSLGYRFRFDNLEEAIRHEIGRQ